jgi:dihydropyrimidinase
MTTSKAFAIVRSLSRRLTWLAALALALPAHVAAQQQPETVIRNGLIVTAEGRLEADVRIRGEIIVEIGPSLAAGAGARQIDAKGMLLLPGAVDTHTHLNSVMPDPPRPDGNQDDYVSGSAAGFAGGVTTVSNFRGLLSGEDEDAYAARVIGAIEANGMADVFIHVNAGNDPTPFGRDRLKALVERGFVSTGEDFMARSGYDHHALEWYQTHEESGKVGVLSMMHAEDFAILQGTRDRLMAEGKGSIHNFAQSAPDVAEVVAVQRVVAIAEATGAPMYILHISSGRALQVAEDAMARGLPVYVEARPMYLHLTQEVYQRPDVGLYLGGPPIRDQWDQDKLWEGIAKGTVHTIGTDHTGHDPDDRKCSCGRDQAAGHAEPAGVPTDDVLGGRSDESDHSRAVRRGYLHQRGQVVWVLPPKGNDSSGIGCRHRDLGSDHHKADPRRGSAVRGRLFRL